MSKFSYQSFLESVQNLRKYLQKEPKFVEKGKELDSGGPLDPNLANIMISILSEIEKQIPGIQVIITTGNDIYHKNLNSDSKHKQGKAIDFTIQPYNSSNGEKVKKILDQFASAAKGFAYLDEYTKPSKYSTGGHFHISFDPKNPEGTHARKATPYGSLPPSEYGRRSDVFDFSTSRKNQQEYDSPIDTWAGFLQRIERES